MANSRARTLRKRLTIAEQRLWDELKLLRHEGFHFRRQAPIGPYVVDFVCFSQRLVIEVDGVQHDRPMERAADTKRGADLNWRGFNVVRFQNGDVMEKLDGVMREVWSHLDSRGDPMPAIDNSAQSFPPFDKAGRTQLARPPPPRGEGLGVGGQSRALSWPRHPTPGPSPSRGGEKCANWKAKEGAGRHASSQFSATSQTGSQTPHVQSKSSGKRTS